uniref:NB-ARC domain-containing protein n=1 Tax=Corethron hystrix TaxID=216773 RepID=A0A7S1BM17_9STRA|mmetsp:Transcript_31035/g.71009  ORF Transcript_31035/g.71009 Transcript_31035/m.71009 type:complete len:1033 (+) Transcript_31035:67-3165(+)
MNNHTDISKNNSIPSHSRDFSGHQHYENDSLRANDSLRTNDDVSTLADVPHEAILSIACNDSDRPTSVGISMNPVDPHSVLADPAVIPRTEILRQIVTFITPEEAKHCPLEGSVDQSSPDNKRLILRGMGGLGKTTIAVMAVNLKELRLHFDHIVWVNLGKCFKVDSHRNNLNYEMYCNCLQKICQQLNLKSGKFGGNVFLQPGDNRMQIAAKYLQAMEEAKCAISKLIDGFKILLVLDDVWGQEDVGLFNFGEHMTSLFSILVTTRILDLEPCKGSKTIDVDLLSREEARYVFRIEAGLSGSINLQDSEVIDNIVNKCGYLVLAVRVAGRLVKTGRSISPESSLNQIAEIVASHTDSPTTAPVINILDRSFLFVPNTIASFSLKLLFSAFAALFHRDDVLRPWVSFDAVLLLWKAIRYGEYLEELDVSLGKFKLTKTGSIVELMCVMGLLEEKYVTFPNQIRHRYVRIHHDLMWDYGKMFASRVFFSQDNFHTCFEHGIPYCYICPPFCNNLSYHQNVQKWSNLIIAYYKLNSPDIDYLVQWFPLHMIKAGLLHEVTNLVKNDSYILNVIKTFGLEAGIHHIIYIKRSLDKHVLVFADADASVSTPSLVAVIVYLHDYLSRFRSLMQLDNSVKREIGFALILLGVELQKYSNWAESLDYFTETLQIFEEIEYDNDHPDIIRVWKHIDSCNIQNLMLVSQGSPSQVRLKHVDALLYEENNLVPLELSSHPGHAIVLMEDKLRTSIFGNMKWKYTYLGVGLKDSALLTKYDGHTIRDANNDHKVLVTMGCYREGVTLTWRTPVEYEKSERENPETTEQVVRTFNEASLFTIKPDGSICPNSAPHLCLGICPFPTMYLVSKNSINRAVFKSSKLLNIKKKHGGVLSDSFVDNGSVEKNEMDDGIILELSSHPGMGIVPVFEELLPVPLINLDTCVLGLGLVEHALSARMNEKGNIVMTAKHKGTIFCVPARDLKAGEFVMTVKSNKVSNHPLVKSFSYDFVFNDDGTISPASAENLVIGFHVPGRKNMNNANRI